MIKTFKIIFLFAVATFLFTSCFTTSRIIKQTEDTAIIQGRGNTKIEAKIDAENAAKKLFVNFEESAAAECTQEYYGSTNMATGGYQAQSYWSCIITIKKK